MLVYQGILRLSSIVLSLGILFNNWANAVSNVWLLGQHLSGRLKDVASDAFRVTVEINALANNWIRFYNDLPSGFSLPWALQRLLAWADDLISMARYFEQWVEISLQRHFRVLWDFYRNPVTVIVNTLTRHTGLTGSFIYNPVGTIRNLIDVAIGNIRDFASNPVGYIVNALRSVYPGLVVVLQDPDGWLLNRLYQFIPDLREFVQDAEAFILERVRRFVDNRIDQASEFAKYIFLKIVQYLW